MDACFKAWIRFMSYSLKINMSQNDAKWTCVRLCLSLKISTMKKVPNQWPEILTEKQSVVNKKIFQSLGQVLFPIHRKYLCLQIYKPKFNCHDYDIFAILRFYLELSPSLYQGWCRSSLIYHQWPRKKSWKQSVIITRLGLWFIFYRGWPRTTRQTNLNEKSFHSS